MIWRIALILVIVWTQPLLAQTLQPATMESSPTEPSATEPPTNDLPRDARSGIFQKLMFDATWLGRLDANSFTPSHNDAATANGLGMGDLELKAVLAVPCPTREWPLLMIPGFAMHFLDAPRSADLPSQVYDVYVMFRWLPKVNERLMFDVAVTPGVYRDFEQNTSDGLRVTAHGAGIWTATPEWKLVAGVLYLNRHDWNVLPLGGLIWTPTKDWNFEILFPQPKAARRVHWFRAVHDDVEDWVYIAGEFADNIWAIERTGGVHDRVAYRDTRVLLGVERKVIGGMSGKAEIGYVFSRKVSYYDTPTPDFVPSDTLLLRVGFTY